MTQLARPISDISAGTWTPSAGSDLYAMLDEATASDSDYIQAIAFASNETCEIEIDGLTDPSVNTGHIVRYRYRRHTGSSSPYDLTVKLLDGATVIATWSHVAIGTTWTDAANTLSGSEADAITDYDDLRLQFIANRTGGGSGAFVQVSFAEVEVPSGGGGPTSKPYYYRLLMGVS